MHHWFSNVDFTNTSVSKYSSSFTALLLRTLCGCHQGTGHWMDPGSSSVLRCPGWIHSSRASVQHAPAAVPKQQSASLNIILRITGRKEKSCWLAGNFKQQKTFQQGSSWSVHSAVRKKSEALAMHHASAPRRWQHRPLCWWIWLRSPRYVRQWAQTKLSPRIFAHNPSTGGSCAGVVSSASLQWIKQLYLKVQCSLYSTFHNPYNHSTEAEKRSPCF